MENHRYQLQKYNGMKTKFQCPECNDKRSFVKYIDMETGKYLSDIVGRCDKEDKCGYHYKPKQFFTDNNIQFTPSNEYSNPKPSKPQQITFIPTEIFNKSLKGYEQNTFINNLLNNIPYPFQMNDVMRVIDLYKLGTITKGYRTGAITFPFIDSFFNVRAVQVKQFDGNNHTIATDFLHSIIERSLIKNCKPIPSWLETYNNNEKKVSCLFGAHLLNQYPNSPIALVEAPKTAIYGTLYFGFPHNPKNLLWLAVYNISSLSLDKMQALKGRNVILFPDLSKNSHAFNLWSTKAKELSQKIPNTKFIVDDFLEKNATIELKSKGADLADILINFDWKMFKRAV